MAAKNAMKVTFVKSRQLTLQVRNFVQISLYPDKCCLRFMQKFKMATQKWRESDFCKTSPVHSADTMKVKNFVEIALSRTVSEINALYAEIQDGCQNWRESDFLRKVASRLCRYPVGPKFCRNRSTLHCLQDKCTFAFYTKI